MIKLARRAVIFCPVAPLGKLADSNATDKGG